MTTTLSSAPSPSDSSAVARRALWSNSWRFVSVAPSKWRRSYWPYSARFWSASDARFMASFCDVDTRVVTEAFHDSTGASPMSREATWLRLHEPPTGVRDASRRSAAEELADELV